MQFIKTYENALSEELIQDLINWADKPPKDLDIPKALDEGLTQFKQVGRLGRDDTQIFLKFSNRDLLERVNAELAPHFESYGGDFPFVKGAISYEIKLQKTKTGASGYSVFHAEQGLYDSATRATAWSVYLNDVSEGGETEFLYQRHKQPAKKGSLVIWPAGYTHVHRGNPPYSNDKYIITGWSQFPYI
jgi:hypothetical protein